MSALRERMEAMHIASRGVNPFLNDPASRERFKQAADKALVEIKRSNEAIREANKVLREAPKGHFTFSHSPDSLHREQWICHHPNGSLAAEFDTCQEAVEAMKTWNSIPECAHVTVDWLTSHDDSDDSDRGTYVVRIKNTRFREDVRCGWHSMEASARLQKKLINSIAKHGLEAVKDILFAADDRYSRETWNTPEPQPPGYTFEI